MKTLKRVEIDPVFVEFVPENLEQNKLYISEKYNGCSHLCLCGCGVTCYLPLNPGEWSIKNNSGKVSITPSILQRFDCKSHYIITNNVANFV
jgi:hypothetical protein